MIVVNAEKLVLGRLASFVAKKALQGEEVVVVNAEKAAITGTMDAAIERMARRIGLHAKGNPRKGPKFSRMPDRALRRSIRGMLPTERSTGREAFRRTRVFISVPDEFKEKKFEELPNAKVDTSKRYVLLGDVCRLLGAKW